jgi:hypothetical protein
MTPHDRPCAWCGRIFRSWRGLDTHEELHKEDDKRKRLDIAAAKDNIIVAAHAWADSMVLDSIVQHGCDDMMSPHERSLFDAVCVAKRLAASCK